MATSKLIRKYILLSAVITAAIAVSVVLLHKISLSMLPQNNKDYKEIIRIVRTSASTGNETLELPQNLKYATCTGKVYVTRRADGLVLILFPIMIGKGDNIRGHLWTSRPLTETDVKGEANIELFGHHRKELIGMFLEESYKPKATGTGPQWYNVFCDWD